MFFLIFYLLSLFALKYECGKCRLNVKSIKSDGDNGEAEIPVPTFEAWYECL